MVVYAIQDSISVLDSRVTRSDFVYHDELQVEKKRRIGTEIERA